MIITATYTKYGQVTISSTAITDKETEYDLYKRISSREMFKQLIEGTLTMCVIPDEVIDIAAYAFHSVGTLDTVIFHDRVKTIGQSAFHNCYNLQHISIPDTVSIIPNYCFCYCKSLSKISLPNSIVKIGDTAFAYCDSLTSFVIPKNVSVLGSRAFQWCPGLTEVTFEGIPNSVSDTLFYGDTNLLTINVPWSEGEVSGAPWGATNATINYNYVGDER